MGKHDGILAKRVVRRRKVCSCTMSGVWRALNYVTGAVVIFHSPRACAHVTHRMSIGSYFRGIQEAEGECLLPKVPLLSSDLEDEEAIFGGEDRLRRAILYAVKNYHPAAIFIANACMAGVIGDDTKAVAQEMAKKIGLSIYAVSTHGFLDGAYFDGYIETANLLFDKFLTPKEENDKAALIIGDCGGFYSKYVTSVRRMLNGFGLEEIKQFPTYISLGELRRMKRPKIVIAIGRYADDPRQKEIDALSEKIAERFGVPCVKGVYPVGFAPTMEWIKSIGKAIGEEERAEKIRERERAAFEEAIAKAREKLTGKKVFFCAGRIAQNFHPKKEIDLLVKLGLDLIGIELFDCYQPDVRDSLIAKIKSFTTAPLFTGGEAEKMMREADFVLTSNEILSPDIKQVFTQFLPGAGWQSEAALIKAMERIVSRRMERGGLIYA